MPTDLLNKRFCIPSKKCKKRGGWVAITRLPKQSQHRVTARIALYFVQDQGESAEFISINEHFQRRDWAK